MNEETQIQAIEAELRAAGYKVVRDRDIAELGLTEANIGRLWIDLYGELSADRTTSAARPQRLIVEIANRRRSNQQGEQRPSRALLDDEAAEWRFKTLSSAIAGLDDAELQIRFLDVSADQASARKLTTTKVGRREEVADQLQKDWAMLGAARRWPMMVQGLLVARLWSHWLRILAYQYPGKGRRELQPADLRVLVKELYDQKVLSLQPRQYASIHRQILAITEGGDVDPSSLNFLRPHLEELLQLAFARFTDEAREPPADDEGVFSDIFQAIETRAPPSRRTELAGAFTLMRFKDGDPDFAAAVARFLLQLGDDDFISREDVLRLLQRAGGLEATWET
jgi:hypothetical protein